MCHLRKTPILLLFLTLLLGCGVSESQVEKYLASMDITLNDDFKVNKSNWSTAPGDMFQTFQVRLSASDTKAIIKIIEGKTDFKEYNANESPQGIFDFPQGSALRVLAYRQGDNYYYGIYKEEKNAGYELQEFLLGSKTETLDFTYVEE